MAKNKCLKTYFLLFGFVLSFTFSLIPKPSQALSWGEAPTFSASQKESVLYKFRSYSGPGLQDVSWSDIHVLASKNQLADSNINFIFYVCEYNDPQGAIQSISNCGTFRVYDGITYKYQLRASYYIELGSNLSESDFYFPRNASDFRSSAESSNGLGLESNFFPYYSGSLSDNPGVILIDDNNKLDEWDFNQPEESSGDWNLFNFLLDGIKAFFQPMINSLNEFFTAFNEGLKDIVEFLQNFFSDATDWLISLFTIDQSLLSTQLDSFVYNFKQQQPLMGQAIELPVSFLSNFVAVSSQMSCSDYTSTAGDFGFASGISLDVCGIDHNIILLARSLILLSLALVFFAFLRRSIKLVLNNKESE